ncbi:MAG: ImmA/IrrE family metallo-endopeptidase [Acidobacteriia bacterium]|nr:ImmA/IrrE family metallo-endopeptidase [Terriglobia bacterium]
MIKAIKADSDLTAALSRIEQLMDLDPDSNSAEGEELEVLTVLAENYEARKVETRVPDPVEAILFRMEQQNLTQRDLIPFIGSRSKVSEILSRKRQLTLSMIRALHNGLGIPAKALLQEQNPTELANYMIDWNRFPVKEMVSRGWLKEYERLTSDKMEAVKKFFEDVRPIPMIEVLYRKSDHLRSARTMDQYSLAAWTARVINVALRNKPKGTYRKGKIDPDFMRALARLSVFDNGPVLACDYLSEQGVSVVIELHLPNTYLDGSAILVNADRPIIALTLRYDRIDNFWFCLMHELAHIYKHMEKGVGRFYDDLDVGDQGNLLENEADYLAGEALIPDADWRNSPARKLKSPEAANLLAKKLGIHVAIVAGRIRHEHKDFRLLNNLVGHKKIKAIFGSTK